MPDAPSQPYKVERVTEQSTSDQLINVVIPSTRTYHQEIVVEVYSQIIISPPLRHFHSVVSLSLSLSLFTLTLFINVIRPVFPIPLNPKDRLGFRSFIPIYTCEHVVVPFEGRVFIASPWESIPDKKERK